MRRATTCSLIALAALCVSAPSRAQDDYYRTGCYLGLAGTVAFPLSVDAPANTDVEESLGLNARAGCRSRWLGGELHFEWLEGFDIEESGEDDEVDGWALTLDGKGYFLAGLAGGWSPLAKRFQPFATLGFGYLDFDGPGKFDDWDFGLRVGGGLDVYVTNNIAINVDATYVLPVSDLQDLDYVSVGWGLLYRF